MGLRVVTDREGGLGGTPAGMTVDTSRHATDGTPAAKPAKKHPNEMRRLRRAVCQLARPTVCCIGFAEASGAGANVRFGGPKLNRLFICATTSLYSVFLNTRAAGSMPRG